MKTFKSWQSYFQFESALKCRSRYIYPPEIQRFLQTVLETAKERVETIHKDSILWRAQLGHDWREESEDVGKVEAPHPPKRMCPLSEKAIEGRANPKGIPYLYLASNRETALAEVRPWIGSYISVGQFKILRELRVVNCTTNGKGFIYFFKEPPAKERAEAAWGAIDRAFAKPVTQSEDVADYAPTQAIAELFKTNGFDGIAYRSSLGKGHNIALFDVQAAEIISCHLFEVRNIKFDFQEAANPYFVGKHFFAKKEDLLNSGDRLLI